MASINDRVRKRLISRFGSNIDLESDNSLIAELISEVDLARLGEPGSNYDRTYTEGYNKEGYSRAAYSKYDRSALSDELFQQVVLPEIEQTVVDRLRAQLGGQP